MIFDLFSNKGSKKPEYVPDEQLYDAVNVVSYAMAQQMNVTIKMSATIPDGEARLNRLISGSFFYGYVTGLSNTVAFAKFSSLVEKDDLWKNSRRLLQGVVANMLFPDSEPDWYRVQAWEAQSAGYGIANNDEYEEGMQIGIRFGEEILSGEKSSAITLLATELLK